MNIFPRPFNHKFLSIIVLGAVLAFGQSSRADLGEAKIISGETTQEEGWLTAQTKTVLELPVTAQVNQITIRGKTGSERNDKDKEIGGISLSFLGDDDKPLSDPDGKPLRSMLFRSQDLTLRGDKTIYPDAYIQMASPLRFYVRPNLVMYKEKGQKQIAKRWKSFPAASEHIFTFELRRDASDGANKLWFDGNLLSEYPSVAPSKLRLTLSPGASLQEISATTVAAPSRLQLPVGQYSRDDGMPDAKLSFTPGVRLPDELQKLAGDAKGIAVAGLGVIATGSDDLQNYFNRRTAAYNLPEQRMFTVPLATYSHASLLVASDEDPAKVDSFTLRVTRYGRTRGNALADTIVQIPATEAKDTDAARRVGTVEYGPAENRKKTALWLLKVPIKNGIIQDILYNDDKKPDIMGTYKYLDIELMNPLQNVEQADAFPPSLRNTSRAYRPSANINSNAHVFGLWLDESPAQLQVDTNVGGQAFYASDKPQFNAKVSADQAGEYSISWEYADVDGKIIGQGQKPVKLAAGGDATIAVPIQAGNGWYAARIVLKDGAGTPLVDYRTSFVMLPPDTRKAGLESPFYGWFFNNHGAEKMTLDEVGPLLQRLGVRRVGLPDSMPESETLPKYGFTNSTISWTQKGLGRQAMSEYSKGTKTLDEAIAMHEEAIREHLKLWPSIDRLLVFHESGASGAPKFPSELWDGEPTGPSEKDKERFEKSWTVRMTYLEAMAKMVREKFPQLKMQYGNDGSSLGLIGELLRRKFPRKYIDTIASEDLGQWIPPERDLVGSTQDGWYLRTLAEKMGYGDVPVTATTEWIGRMVDSGRPLGLLKQAEWKARDSLMALSYGYDTISVAGINDASDAYYYSIWANGGLTTRYPLMSPRPSYAAIATLTQVLDRAKFQRFVPTGSTVCYLEEFQRDGDWIYALWTPRGEREVSLVFSDDAPRVLTDLFGRESSVNGKTVPLTGDTSVQYLSSKTKLVSASAGKSTFPEDLAYVPDKSIQTIPLEKADSLVSVPDPTREGKADIGYISVRSMTQGSADLREVDDPEMGKCLEIELKPRPGLTWRDIEYLTLNLPEPLVTKAKSAGLWIKGNGSWAAVDVLTEGEPPWRGNHRMSTSWLSDDTLNFDGWNFLPFPVRLPDSGDTTVTGLGLVLPHTTLVGNQREPVKNLKIRIKKIELW